jgi:hypothetical protein
VIGLGRSRVSSERFFIFLLFVKEKQIEGEKKEVEWGTRKRRVWNSFQLDFSVKLGMS